MVKNVNDLQSEELSQLIAHLNEDRAWLLEQIDKGRWAEFRLDLAALEREMGQLLNKVAESLEKE